LDNQPLHLVNDIERFTVLGSVGEICSSELILHTANYLQGFLVERFLVGVAKSTFVIKQAKKFSLSHTSCNPGPRY
jgi:hypothetical protein